MSARAPSSAGCAKAVACGARRRASEGRRAHGAMCRLCRRRCRLCRNAPAKASDDCWSPTGASSSCASRDMPPLGIEPRAGDGGSARAWWTEAADEVVALAAATSTRRASRPPPRRGADAIHLAMASWPSAQLRRGGHRRRAIWVGPPPEAMRALGDKAAARRLPQRRRADASGLRRRRPVGRVLRREAARIGFPVLVKPSAGGGGKGMHVVRAAVDLARHSRSPGARPRRHSATTG